MENENNTNPTQTVSVVKTGDGYLVLLSGNGRELIESLTVAIKGLFTNILKTKEIEGKAKVIKHAWADLAFDPLHMLIQDKRISADERREVAKAMVIIMGAIHSLSSNELKEVFDDDEDSDDSSID